MGNIVITKGQNGLGRKAPSKDMVSAIMFGGVLATGLALNTTSSKLSRKEDAENLGINEAYDTTNKVLVYHHISEFFKRNPNGELYIRITAQGTSMTDMCDKTKTHLKTLLQDVGGDVRQAGVVLNPLASYTATLAGGLDADVLGAIPKAQALAEGELDLKRPLQIVLEGRSFNGPVGPATDLRSLNAENVHVTIMADNSIAGSQTIHSGYAALGVTLGTISSAEVNESIGWTNKFDLIDRENGLYLDPYLSSGAKASTVEADYQALTDKGFIFARNYVGQSGTYFDAFPTCKNITSDYAWGQEQRVIQKAIRLTYDALFPMINSPIKIDSTTGAMDVGTAKTFEQEAESGLNVMVSQSQVSGISAFVDVNQDVQATGTVVVVIKIVSIATGRVIEIKLGFAKQI